MDDVNMELINILSEISNTLMANADASRSFSSTVSEALVNQNLILQEINDNLKTLAEKPTVGI